jgi:uncharacterized protein (DUF1330 family)
MAAYLVVEVTGVLDEAGLVRYVEEAARLVARDGGRYFTCGSVAAVLEGEHQPLLGVL